MEHAHTGAVRRFGLGALVAALAVAATAPGADAPPAQAGAGAERTLALSAPAGPWRSELRRAAAAWNHVGLPVALRVVRRDVAGAVRVELGRVRARCGAQALACVVTGAGRPVLVLPARPPGDYRFEPGAGPLTLVAHELGHVLGLGHRTSGCTLMRAQPSAAGCASAALERTVPLRSCRLAGPARAWGCPREQQRLELCGPTAQDAAVARRAYGLAPVPARTTLCVASELARPSRRTELRMRNAGLRIALRPAAGSLRRAFARGAPSLRRWCLGAERTPLPAVAVSLCAGALAQPSRLPY